MIDNLTAGKLAGQMDFSVTNQTKIGRSDGADVSVPTRNHLSACRAMCFSNPACHSGAGTFSPTSVGDFVIRTVEVHGPIMEVKGWKLQYYSTRGVSGNIRLGASDGAVNKARLDYNFVQFVRHRQMEEVRVEPAGTWRGGATRCPTPTPNLRTSNRDSELTRNSPQLPISISFIYAYVRT